MGDTNENVFMYTVIVDLDVGITQEAIERAVYKRMLLFLEESKVVAVSDLIVHLHKTNFQGGKLTWEGVVWGERYGR